MPLMCRYGLKGSLPTWEILWFYDSVHCSALRGKSGPASCRRRAPRHEVIALTQEESILQSWVQFCIWLSQGLGMTASSVQSWRLEGKTIQPSLRVLEMYNPMTWTCFSHDRTCFMEIHFQLFTFGPSFVYHHICLFWSSHITEQRST